MSDDLDRLARDEAAADRDAGELERLDRELEGKPPVIELTLADATARARRHGISVETAAQRARRLLAETKPYQWGGAGSGDPAYRFERDERTGGTAIVLVPPELTLEEELSVERLERLYAASLEWSQRRRRRPSLVADLVGLAIVVAFIVEVALLVDAWLAHPLT